MIKQTFLDYGLKLKMFNYCQELSTYYLGLYRSTIKGLYSGKILLVNELLKAPVDGLVTVFPIIFHPIMFHPKRFTQYNVSPNSRFIQHYVSPELHFTQLMFCPNYTNLRVSPSKKKIIANFIWN